MYLFSSLVALSEELDSITSELHAVDIQIQELLERQQELIQKKNVLTKRIKLCLEDSEAGESSECDSSPASWNKEGWLSLFFFFFASFVSSRFFELELNHCVWVSAFQ